jgi:cytoskeletal protein CcmA (bactofilin family)
MPRLDRRLLGLADPTNFEGPSPTALERLPSRPQRMPRPSFDVSVLGPSTRVTGRVSGDGSLRVEGKVRGDIQISGDAEIAPSASVEGNVSAASLDISGTLQGDVVASGLVAIRSGAVVRGELRGAEISIEPGSRVSVRLATDFELDLGPDVKRR